MSDFVAKVLAFSLILLIGAVVIGVSFSTGYIAVLVTGKALGADAAWVYAVGGLISMTFGLILAVFGGSE